MASSSEYLRDINTFIKTISDNHLLTQDFEKSHGAFENQGNASTQTISITSTEGEVNSGIGALKLLAQDATGAGTMKTVRCDWRAAINYADRFRFTCIFQVPFVETNWHEILFGFYRYENPTGGSILLKFDSNLGVSNELYLINEAGSYVSVAGWDTDYFPDSAAVFPWHRLEMILNFSAGNAHVENINFSGRDFTPQVDSGDQFSLAREPHMTIFAQFGNDADNTARHMIIDKILWEKL